MICKVCKRDDGKEPHFNNALNHWVHLCAYCAEVNHHASYKTVSDPNGSTVTADDDAPAHPHTPPHIPDNTDTPNPLRHVSQLICPHCQTSFDLWSNG